MLDFCTHTKKTPNLNCSKCSVCVLTFSSDTHTYTHTINIGKTCFFFFSPTPLILMLVCNTRDNFNSYSIELIVFFSAQNHKWRIGFMVRRCTTCRHTTTIIMFIFQKILNSVLILITNDAM